MKKASQSRKLFSLLLILSMILALAACGGSGSGSGSGSGNDPGSTPTAEPVETISLKLSTAFGENSTVQQSAVKFSELLAEASNGRYSVTIYPSDQLASGNQISAIELVQVGSTELDLRGFCIFSTIDPRATVVNMPFILPSNEEVDSIFFGGTGAEALSGVVADMGLQTLAWGECGYRQITNNVREITSPDDMVGLRFRIPPMPMFSSLYQCLGTDPTTIGMGEVFTALQQGVADGQENAIDTAASYKLQEVQDYFTCWNGVYDPLLFSASPEFWDTLSAEDQQMFLDCAAEAMSYQIEINRENEETLWEVFEEAGCHVTHLTDDQIAAFKDACQPVYDEWKDDIGAELLAAFGYTD